MKWIPIGLSFVVALLLLVAVPLLPDEPAHPDGPTREKVVLAAGLICLCGGVLGYVNTLKDST